MSRSSARFLIRYRIDITPPTLNAAPEMAAATIWIRNHDRMQRRNQRRHCDIEDRYRETVSYRRQQRDRQAEPADTGPPHHDQIHPDDKDHRGDRELEHVAPRRAVGSKRANDYAGDAQQKADDCQRYAHPAELLDAAARGEVWLVLPFDRLRAHLDRLSAHGYRGELTARPGLPRRAARGCPFGCMSEHGEHVNDCRTHQREIGVILISHVALTSSPRDTSAASSATSSVRPARASARSRPPTSTTL